MKTVVNSTYFILSQLLQERCGLIQPKFAKHVDLSHCNLGKLLH